MSSITAWIAAGFNDSAWASGPAQLGYGDGDETTVVSYGPDANNKYITTYFRRAFLVTNAAGGVRGSKAVGVVIERGTKPA